MKTYSQQLEMVDLLSSGEEAEVWHARDVVSGADVILKKTLLSSDVAREALLERIRITRVLGESGVLPAQDLVVERGEIGGFTTRQIAVLTLAQIGAEFGDAILTDCLLQICQGMAYLHSLDYLHCDLKPANVLFEKTHAGVRAHITDLDWAVHRGAQSPTTFRGTPRYIAPEVTTGKPLTEAADVFSFGRFIAEAAALVTSKSLARQLSDLSRQCVLDSPEDRPQLFWEVHEKIQKAHRELGNGNQEVTFPPPLRNTGLATRCGRIDRHLSGREGDRLRNVHLVIGPRGIGKTRVLSEFCFRKQLAGATTVRVEDVSSVDELYDSLARGHLSRISHPSGTGQPSLWGTVTTDPALRIPSADLDRIDTLAGRLGLMLLIEDHSPKTGPEYGDDLTSRISPFGERECIASLGHLTENPPLSGLNGRALAVATGGIPLLVRQYTDTWHRAYRIGHRREPINFDSMDGVVTEYWGEQYEIQTSHCRNLLERAAIFHNAFALRWLVSDDLRLSAAVPAANELTASGWLAESKADGPRRRYRFASRSARNFMRSQIPTDRLRHWARMAHEELTGHAANNLIPAPDLWEIARLAGLPTEVPAKHDWRAKALTISDRKLAVYSLLRDFRAVRRCGGCAAASLASEISDGFEFLHSPRRQERWARRSLRLSENPDAISGLLLTEARTLCRLHDLTLDTLGKQTALRTLLEVSREADDHVRGYLLSELSATHLLLGENKQATGICYEAHHLLKKHAPESREYVRNLNRLAMTLQRDGHFAAARKYHEQCQRMAQSLGFEDILWISIGNLVLLTRATGEPDVGVRYARRQLKSHRETHRVSDYAMGLISALLCYVDLGQGNRALRAARLCHTLMDMIGDPLQVAYALTNIGWILTMQGNLKEARRSLEAAVRLYQRMGNHRNAALCKLNMAWCLLQVHRPDEAIAICRSVLTDIEPYDELPGRCELGLIQAQAHVLSGDYDSAAHTLDEIPSGDPLLPPRVRTQVSLGWLNLMVWAGDVEAAGQLVAKLADDKVVERVHPFRCDFNRARGHLHVLDGDHDKALEYLGRAAMDSRGGQRLDKMLETMLPLALLAARRGNWATGLRYLRSAQEMIEVMRGKFLCPPC